MLDQVCIMGYTFLQHQIYKLFIFVEIMIAIFHDKASNNQNIWLDWIEWQNGDRYKITYFFP